MFLLLTAMECIAPISVRNQTDQHLSIYIVGVTPPDYSVDHKNLMDNVRPGEIAQNYTADLRHDLFYIEAKNAQDSIVFQRWYTASNLKTIRWNIVIQNSDLIE